MFSRMQRLWIVLGLCIAVSVSAYQIQRIEYTFDAVTGWTTLTNPNVDSISGTYNVPVTGLPVGWHTLLIRGVDDHGRYGYTNAKTFYLERSLNTVVNYAEYFIDSDPGVTRGSEVIFRESDSVNVSFVVPLTTLSNGLHCLGLRAFSRSNQISFPILRPFWVERFNTTLLNRAEYFVDTDPGVGSATSVTITQADSVSSSFVAPLTTLSNGPHALVFRIRTTAGTWSLPVVRPMWVERLNTTTLSRAEYFVDTDPGVGSATSVTITQSDSVSSSFIVPLTTMSNGPHSLVFRIRTPAGTWSLPVVRPMWVERMSTRSLSSAEYFVDTDPGVGSATAVTFTQSDSVSSSFVAPLTTMSNGPHTLVFRVRTSTGTWSLPFVRPMWVERLATTTLNDAEYFIDTDPGVGSATHLTITSADSIGGTFTVPLTTVPRGLHTLVFRVRDAAGRWTVPATRTFWKENVTGTLPRFTRAEYFIDTDPGVGSGIAVTVNNADSISASFTANLDGLSLSDHSLYLRVKDELGKWSHPVLAGFLIAQPPGNPTYLTVLFQTTNAVLNWTASPSTIAGYRIYRHTSGHFTPPGTGTLIATVNSTTTTYTDTNVNGQYYYRVTAYNNLSGSSSSSGSTLNQSAGGRE